MCGITGYFLKKKMTDDRSFLVEMRDSMSKRGPDDSGSYFFNTRSDDKRAHNLGMAHRRLSILDLSELGHQPMTYDGITIVFNGEIFNYLELREDLLDKGHVFESKTDTEVIIKAYQEYGTDCQNHFNGMWAFALYDSRRNILFCSRDRFGIKPLFFYDDSDFFVFGSEIKSLFRFPMPKISINHNQLMVNLMQGYRFVDNRRHTYFRQVKQLLPAECFVMDLDDGSKEFSTYWKIDPKRRSDLTEEQAIERFRELFIDSVKIRLRSDVPYAFTLSGGMDSSSIISVSNKVLGRETVSFSAIYSKGNQYDEQEFIQYTVDDLGHKHHYVAAELGDFFENLKMMIRYNDEPLCTVTFYSQWQVMKKIKEMGYTVVLSGYAADELVAGYYDHYLYNMYDMEMQGLDIDHELESWHKNHNKPISQWHDFRRDMDNSDFLSPKKELYSSIFRQEFLEGFEEMSPVLYTKESILKNRLMNELRYETVPAVLRPEDRNSMMFSLESRIPFLDYRLVEFCFSLPNSIKIRDGSCKYIQREAMKGILNENVRKRVEKVGFNAPMNDWMKNELKDKIEVLLDDDLRIYRFIIKERLISLWKEHIEGNENHMMLFWSVLNIEFWIRYYEQLDSIREKTKKRCSFID